MNASFPGNWRPDTTSTVPLFEQVKLRILAGTDDGGLPPGTRLPAVRALATELGVAPHTVARAYKELEAAAVVATKGRNGTVVLARDESLAALETAAAHYAQVARDRGISFAEAVQVLAAAYDAGP